MTQIMREIPVGSLVQPAVAFFFGGVFRGSNKNRLSQLSCELWV